MVLGLQEFTDSDLVSLICPHAADRQGKRMASPGGR
jgi:hypothetical protein